MNVIALVLVSAATLSAQSVEGTTVRAADGQPLAGVNVRLLKGERTVEDAKSDTQGAFRFDGLADGDYSLEFYLQGYRAPDRASPARRPFRVIAGGTPVRIDARLVQLASISGRVTGDGRPIAGADVHLLLAENFIGQLQRTNANGEFVIRDVSPGTYMLNARPTKSAAPTGDRDGGKFAWVRTWYPSAADAGGAGKVVLLQGADLPGQDIALCTVPVHRVSGRVLAPDGDPMGGVAVKAIPSGEFAVQEFELETRSAADGVYAFEGLHDGNWRLAAEAKTGGVELYAAHAETVSGRDRENVDMRFVTPFSVTGKAVRTPTGTPAEKKQIGVSLDAKEGGFRHTWGLVQDDGSFRIDNVAQGVYRFHLDAPGAPYYLASVEMGGRDLKGQWVEIVPGTLPVTITYRADGGTVRGAVEDCGSATVMLVPQEPALQYADFIRQATCQPGGRFEIAAVHPGGYYVFAFDRPPGMLELGPFAGEWMSQTLRITVRAGESTEASVKVTQRGLF
jgi:hypothetical protein